MLTHRVFVALVPAKESDDALGGNPEPLEEAHLDHVCEYLREIVLSDWIADRLLFLVRVIVREVVNAMCDYPTVTNSSKASGVSPAR